MVPERGVCTAAKGVGEYLDATCTQEGVEGGPNHEFVWLPLAKPGALTWSAGTTALRSFTPEGAELPAVECEKAKGKGKMGATTTNFVVTLEGCSSAGERCTGGQKAKPGQIVTFELEGTLGLLREEEEVGEEIVGKGPGGLSLEFKCGANEIETEGAVIGQLIPVNASASTISTLTFGATGSKQDWENFEGGPNAHLVTEINGLGGGTFAFSSTVSGNATLKGPKAEIKPKVTPHDALCESLKAEEARLKKEIAEGKKLEGELKNDIAKAVEPQKKMLEETLEAVQAKVKFLEDQLDVVKKHIKANKC